MITLKDFLTYYPKYCGKIHCVDCPLEDMDEDYEGNVHFWCKFTRYFDEEYYVDIISLTNDAYKYVELAKQFEKKQAEAF